MPSVEDHPEPPFPDELEAPIPGEPDDEHEFEEMARSRAAARFYTLWDDLPESVRSHAYEDELVRVRFKPTGTGYRLVGEDSEGRES